MLELTDELGRLHDMLADPSVASVRLVTTPESMVVAETRRVWSYLGLFGYKVDSLVVNRVVPDDASDPGSPACSKPRSPTWPTSPALRRAGPRPGADPSGRSDGHR